jgi:hypothetical protein
MRFVAVLLALTLATTGCATPSQTRTAGLIAGGVLVAGGVGMLVAMDPGDDDHTLSEGGTAACVLGGCVLAGSAIVAGLAVAALSVILTDDDETPRTAAVAPSAELATAAPAPTIKVDLLPVGPLPDRQAELSTVQLARQARSAAARGDCSVALVMRGEIESRDPTYAAALTHNATLGDCR